MLVLHLLRGQELFQRLGVTYQVMSAHSAQGKVSTGRQHLGARARFRHEFPSALACPQKTLPDERSTMRFRESPAPGPATNASSRGYHA